MRLSSASAVSRRLAALATVGKLIMLYSTIPNCPAITPGWNYTQVDVSSATTCPIDLAHSTRVSFRFCFATPTRGSAGSNGRCETSYVADQAPPFCDLGGTRLASGRGCFLPRFDAGREE